MSGPVEEVGKAAGGFIEALKREPLSLALVVMNLALLVMFYVILMGLTKQRASEITQLHQEQKEVRELLARCQRSTLGLDLQDRS